MQPKRVFLGFDANEMRACNVAIASMYQHASRATVRVDRISRLSLWGQYTRPTSRMPSGQLFDEISGAPMSTDHAIARFWVPLLMDYKGWALFADGDVLFRDSVEELFALADATYAVQVVQHPPLLEEGTKKDGLIQQAYPKKNWSSVILFNCGHPANKALTVEVLNSWTGRELHRFGWLKDEEVGSLPAKWNHLVGVSPATDDVALAHFTLGLPDVEGHQPGRFTDEWLAVARAAGYRLTPAPERQAS